MFDECFGDGPFIFRLNDTGTGPQLLTQVCLERGWKEFSLDSGENWNLWWRTSGFPVSHHKSLYAWQYINHIPKGSAICRKDNLVRYLRCMKKVYGSVYDFSPHGYNLPLEYTKLAAECTRNRSISAKDELEGYSEEKPVWICKPVAQSQGRGIFLFRKLSELNYDTTTIVQKYIEKPLLIGGYKFDLRLYVCIPSYHPITIYMYREGLARFGTDKFTLNDLRNPFRHLTNSSINKLGPGYAEMKDRIGSGCKWTFKQLRRYFQQAGISDWLLWQRISTLVILTLLSHMSQVPPTVNCFEFFGFDVLIDSMLKPWLLEVNLSPALGNDCDADRVVKKPMLHDMFDLLGLPLYNTGLSVFNVWNEETKENLKEEDINNNNICTTNKQTILNAAGRWKRKHRSASTIRPRSSSRTKPKTPSSVNSVHNITLPRDQHKLGRDKVSIVNKSLEFSKLSSTKRWGNGRDWKTPPPQEGGWVRLWPTNLDNNFNDNKNNPIIKTMVAQVMKLNKTAKDIAKTHPVASECQLNEFLIQEMKLTREIWIPPI